MRSSEVSSSYNRLNYIYFSFVIFLFLFWQPSADKKRKKRRERRRRRLSLLSTAVEGGTISSWYGFFRISYRTLWGPKQPWSAALTSLCHQDQGGPPHVLHPSHSLQGKTQVGLDIDPLLLIIYPSSMTQDPTTSHHPRLKWWAWEISALFQPGLRTRCPLREV